MKYLGMAVSGKMLSGKGEFLKVLKENSKIPVYGIAFADKLKIITRQILQHVNIYCSLIGFKRADEYTKAFFEDISEDLLGVGHPKISALAESLFSFARTDLVAEVSAKIDPKIQLPFQQYDFEDIDKVLFPDIGKPRKLLQLLGTEYVRDVNPTTWLDYVFRTVIKNPDKLFVITDARFPNELDFAKSKGFLTVKTFSSRESRLNRGKERDGQDYSEHLDHPSETAADFYSVDVEIENNGSREEFVQKVLKTPELERICQFN